MKKTVCITPDIKDNTIFGLRMFQYLSI